MKKIDKVMQANGNEIPYQTAVHYMDDEIREYLHGHIDVLGIEDDQAFYDMYCKKHEEKYGEEFIIN